MPRMPIYRFERIKGGRSNLLKIMERKRIETIRGQYGRRNTFTHVGFLMKSDIKNIRRRK
jgi:hypothetical protein